MVVVVASTDESQFQETSTSSQSLFETSNFKTNTCDDDGFQNDSYDDHLSSLRDLITSGLQECDIYEDPRAYSRNEPRLSLSRLCTSDK